ncbi:unnamed protein product [Protopolystoma xenopodis]|uniref:Uncharacterized protein n=1 Tax=Protopolystoma xenopodis TaxID=117903 RepID=A0A448WY73_9PLAT|nr:unnamed protein product [Protopolystoma xenopodis]
MCAHCRRISAHFVNFSFIRILVTQLVAKLELSLQLGPELAEEMMRFCCCAGRAMRLTQSADTEEDSLYGKRVGSVSSGLSCYRKDTRPDGRKRYNSRKC